MSARIATPPPERVRRRTRLSLTAVLAVVLPVATIGGLSLVHPELEQPTGGPPAESPLTLVSLTCPGAGGGESILGVGSADGVAGKIELSTPPELATLTVPQRGVVEAEADRAGAARAKGDLAPGLVAARISSDLAAASACWVPQPETWFTGLGAAARHASIIELVNPDPGPAVADIELASSRGPVDAPSLRGITVAGGTSVRLNLAELTPIRGELAAHVAVSRGRLGSFVTDTFDFLGAGGSSTDWLPRQAPGETALLPGLAAGTGVRTLVVANPGETEVRVGVKVLTEDAAFTPSDFRDLEVPPGSVVRVAMADVIDPAMEDGAVGLALEADGPITAALRSLVDGDLSFAVPVVPLDSPSGLVLPDGSADVIIGSEGVGVVKVVATTEAGKVKTKKVELAPGRVVTVALPPDAVLVTVSAERAAFWGVVVTTGAASSSTVLPLTSLVRSGVVPDVRPVLP